MNSVRNVLCLLVGLHCAVAMTPRDAMQQIHDALKTILELSPGELGFQKGLCSLTRRQRYTGSKIVPRFKEQLDEDPTCLIPADERLFNAFLENRKYKTFLEDLKIKVPKIKEIKWSWSKPKVVHWHF